LEENELSEMPESNADLLRKRQVQRVQFDFSSQQMEMLDAIVQKTGAATRAEMVRRALATYDIILELGGADDIVEIKNKKGEIIFRAPLKMLL
jgi:hypothetical protein